MSRSVPSEASRARIIKEKLPVFAYFPAENRRSRAFVADVCGKNSKKIAFFVIFRQGSAPRRFRYYAARVGKMRKPFVKSG